MGKSPLLANFLCILRENEGATRRLKPLQLDSNSRGFDTKYYTTSSPSFMITVWCSCLSITTIHSPSFHLVIDGNYVNVTELSVTSIISIIIDLDKRVTCMNLWVWLGFENDVHWFFFSFSQISWTLVFLPMLGMSLNNFYWVVYHTFRLKERRLHT